MHLYDKMRAQAKGRKSFILLDGPIYSNGHLHIGHALNRILKDTVLKAKSFSGYDTPFIPGWDCHGLPIELNVEKKLGKAGVKVSAAEFRKACREFAENFVAIQREEFKRLGIQADWAHLYQTMDKDYEANIIRCLAEIIKNGHLQKGYKPVYWCLDCGSALAEAEVEYADKTSHAIDVGFRVVDEDSFLDLFGLKKTDTGTTSIPIWTTTPWTLPANQAVALNPLLDYVLIRTDKGEKLLVAEALLETVAPRLEIESHTVLARIKGQALEGVKLQHPFYQRQVRVVLGEHVTTDTAPAPCISRLRMAKKIM